MIIKMFAEGKSWMFASCLPQITFKAYIRIIAFEDGFWSDLSWIADEQIS